MTKLILAAIVTVGGFAFWIWKRYFSKSAEIARKKNELRKIRREMKDAIRKHNYDKYHWLDAKRMRLNKEIAALRS